ncbi:MAG: hypothetical protein ABIP74_04385 [Candidatus Saccharimonas sp.]
MHNAVFITVVLIISLLISNRIARYPILQHQIKCVAMSLAAFASVYSIFAWWAQPFRGSMNLIDWIAPLILAIITAPMAVVSCKAFKQKFGFSPASS